jgi:hypothetical protein
MGQYIYIYETLGFSIVSDTLFSGEIRKTDWK